MQDIQLANHKSPSKEPKVGMRLQALRKLRAEGSQKNKGKRRSYNNENLMGHFHNKKKETATHKLITSPILQISLHPFFLFLFFFFSSSSMEVSTFLLRVLKEYDERWKLHMACGEHVSIVSSSFLEYVGLLTSYAFV